MLIVATAAKAGLCNAAGWAGKRAGGAVGAGLRARQGTSRRVLITPRGREKMAGGQTACAAVVAAALGIGLSTAGKGKSRCRLAALADNAPVPCAVAARSRKSHTENFSPCGDATGREEMAGRLGLFEDALFFASCAMGFAGGKTFCVVIDVGRRYVWLWCFSRKYPHICNAGALQVVCTLILPDGTVESVVAFFWSAVVWQMWAGTGAGWTS